MGKDKNAVFLIDGFNLYYSIISILKEKKKNYKWLDVKSFSESFLHLIDKKVKIKKIYYFTSIVKETEDDKNKSHRQYTYIEALKNSGIEVITGKFKDKTYKCPHCNTKIKTYVEKLTDINIASKIFEVCITEKIDYIVVVSGDTDIVPAIKISKKLFKSIKFIAIFPYGRANKEIKTYVDEYFKASEKSYQANQFPEEILLKNSKILKIPKEWKTNNSIMDV